MEQSDYLLREIEKIGALMGALRQRLFGGEKNESSHLEIEIENAKDELLRETNFDLNTFLDPNTQPTNEA